MPRTSPYDIVKFDWLLLAASMLLVVFGLTALYSTSLAGAGGPLSSGGSAVPPDLGNFWKQFWFAVFGLVLAMALPAFDYRSLARTSKQLLILSVLLLLAVLIFGSTVRGTTGWFGIAGFGIQPVELVKFLVIVFLAKYLSDYAGQGRGLRHVLVSGLAMLPVVALVLMQPDFGSAFLLLVVWAVLVMVAGIRRSHLLLMAVGLAVVAVLAWTLLLRPYQKDRITSFLDPDSDPLGRGYNVTQSIIAIGSGGLTGKGMGYGSQSQLRFLPERQTDFIFAVIAEELGFVGVFFLCLLFGVMFWRGFRLAVSARDDFSAYLALGITVSIAVEVFVNLGGNLRLMPVTGMTLPFVSYGGSSLLVKFVMVGVLESMSMKGTKS
ncbi:rod shape-determining protein RodA [Candidatus Uhrbacteria bacterium CG_4_10_14_0_8_um_filter_58_22]|uniref:Probable peptidoglycan glycosyltransferase FtsW n=1 Tax=Candidatus Uhrbacteria bacterium CG_4_10_14_0_8_um_filter_58_22 TaxID=1975029 RepID=A0A2M7QBA7_9BACT|nr:MAG: rod shape-determining protein RodA [Parcubacteria group bacterium CG1_02_58_44]PIY62894.1 MAG: rod shape-determining protein RodA [Candidatus Uhrbacteria bacterium CG_4_10_14_0_8_um_filter_58_22]